MFTGRERLEGRFSRQKELFKTKKKQCDVTFEELKTHSSKPNNLTKLRDENLHS